MDWTNMQVSYIAGTPYVGANVHMKPGPGGNRGELTAWDPVNRRPVWTVKENFPIWSGTVVTAGDLVFYGTHGRLVQSGGCAHRQAAVAVQGRQRNHRPADQLSRPRRPPVRRGAVRRGRLVGCCGIGPVDPRDGSAALGMVNAMSDLPKYTTAGGTLYVFSLPH